MARKTKRKHRKSPSLKRQARRRLAKMERKAPINSRAMLPTVNFNG